MDFLKNIFKTKDKKKMHSLVIMFCAGVALLILSKTMFNFTPSVNSPQNDYPQTTSEPSFDYSSALASELEDILSLVEGAGDVRVMLTFSQNGEKVIAQDSISEKSETEEKDTNGAARTVEQSQTNDKAVIVKNSDGSELPVILTEYLPAINGAIIVAKGGDNPFVIDGLTRATCAVLNIETHKVSVLKMK